MTGQVAESRILPPSDEWDFAATSSTRHRR